MAKKLISHPDFRCGTGKVHIRDNEATRPVRRAIRLSLWPICARQIRAIDSIYLPSALAAEARDRQRG